MSNLRRLLRGSSSYQVAEKVHLLEDSNYDNVQSKSSQSSSLRNDLTDAERVMLSAVEKWTKHGRFPYKLILQSAILMLAIVQIFSVLSQFTIPVSSGEDIFAHFFLQIDSATETSRIYGIDEMLDRVQSIVSSYYTLDNQTIPSYLPETNPDTGEPLPILMVVDYHISYTRDAPFTVKKEYYLTNDDDLGPLGGSRSEAKKFLNHSQFIDISFNLFDDVASTQFGQATLIWKIRLQFTNVGGIFEAAVWTTRRIKNSIFLYSLGWIPAAIAITSSVSLFLGLKAIFSSFQVLRRTRKSWNEIPLPTLAKAYKLVDAPGVRPIYMWNEIPTTVKLDFFSSWDAIESIGEICLIVGCCLGFALDHGLPVSDESRLFLGAGMLMICINFIKYLEYWKKFSVLVLTLQGSFLRNLRFIISVFPMYMGFVICGYIMFAPYSRYFQSIDTTAVTLFALINGDDTHAIFGNLRENYPWPKISQAYLFSFDMLFITLVLNVFLYIIEDAYQAASVWINNAGDKRSRSHRRLRADVHLPSNWRPMLGSVEFDIPMLFRVLEKSKEIMGSEVELHSDVDDFTSAMDHDHSSSEPQYTPSVKTLTTPPTSSKSLSKSISKSLSKSISKSLSKESTSKSLSKEKEVLEMISEVDNELLTQESPKLDSVEGLRTAVEAAVARTHLEFVQQVEVKIKAMQDEYADRLKKEVSEIIDQACALQQRAPKSQD